MRSALTGDPGCRSMDALYARISDAESNALQPQPCSPIASERRNVFTHEYRWPEWNTALPDIKTYSSVQLKWWMSTDNYQSRHTPYMNNNQCVNTRPRYRSSLDVCSLRSQSPIEPAYLPPPFPKIKLCADLLRRHYVTLAIFSVLYKLSWPPHVRK